MFKALKVLTNKLNELSSIVDDYFGDIVDSYHKLKNNKNENK